MVQNARDWMKIMQKSPECHWYYYYYAKFKENPDPIFI